MAVQRIHRPQMLRHQRGLSLVELMVALTIGLFLMGAVSILYVNTSTTSRGSTLESQMNEDATLALELLQQQIRLAGFSNVDASGSRLFTGRAIRGCDGGFTNNGGGVAFEAQSCSGSVSGSDAIAIRYEANLLNSQAVLSGGVQNPANCAMEGITAWNALAEGAATATPMTLADNRYYVANDPNNGNTPSLYCQGRTGAGFGNATPLIPNIESMQIQYAVTQLPTAGNPIPHQVAGYVEAQDAALGATAINWSRVSAIRVCLIARSAGPVPLGDNAVDTLGTYFDCNGVSRTVTDRLVRRAYVTTIQLRNMRPGLPADYVAGNDPWAYLYDN